MGEVDKILKRRKKVLKKLEKRIRRTATHWTHRTLEN